MSVSSSDARMMKQCINKVVDYPVMFYVKLQLYKRSSQGHYACTSHEDVIH